MSLLALQTAFRDEIVAGDEGPPPSSLGMDIYRSAYRGRLLTALETSFERTHRWVGEEAFTAAASHYVLMHPPRAWSLDDYGCGFPALLETLFADDPEVDELAWLEWNMQRAFAAPDIPELDPAALAAADYSESDWDRLGFTMAAGFARRPIMTNCTALWSALVDDTDFVITTENAFLLVWRSGLLPRFRVCEEAEYYALTLLAERCTLGAIAQSVAAERLAHWLTRWLREGIFAEATLR